ncbi:unnamed protein product [Camellia sinensis]
MPFCYVASYQSGEDGVVDNGIKIFYRTYGHGPIKVLMIIGLAGTHDSWLPQIEGLTGTVIPNVDQLMAAVDHRDAAAELGGDGDDESGGVEVCAFDNRGMGRSSVPTKKSDYATTIMAKDAVALMDHLGWRKAHVFGHSMGAMISCKLAAMVPERVLSLALLNVTGGGYQCLPKLDRKTLSIAIRFLRAKTPEQRAAVDLDTHYSKEYLEEYVGPNTRRAILYQRQLLPSLLAQQYSDYYAFRGHEVYQTPFKEGKKRGVKQYVRGISASGMQSNCGFDGQINACWMHKMSRKELELICSAGFLISVIHGRHDIIAQLYYARKLAEKLNPVARMVELHGGHLVSHERTEEVNQALVELIQASEKKMNPYDWTNIHKKNSGCLRGLQGCVLDSEICQITYTIDMEGDYLRMQFR